MWKQIQGSRSYLNKFVYACDFCKYYFHLISKQKIHLQLRKNVSALQPLRFFVKCFSIKNPLCTVSENNNEQDNGVIAVEETDFDMSLTGMESEFPDQQLIKLFRRLTLPFKKANRRYAYYYSIRLIRIR